MEREARPLELQGLNFEGRTIHDVIHSRGWDPITVQSGTISLPVVRAFYVGLMEQLTHWVDSYDVTVWDVTVTFSAQRIAEFLGLPRPEGPAIPELEDLAPLQPFDLFRLCTESGENVPGAPHIVHKTLNDFFRMLHLIMAYNIDRGNARRSRLLSGRGSWLPDLSRRRSAEAEGGDRCEHPCSESPRSDKDSAPFLQRCPILGSSHRLGPPVSSSHRRKSGVDSRRCCRFSLACRQLDAIRATQEAQQAQLDAIYTTQTAQTEQLTAMALVVDSAQGGFPQCAGKLAESDD
ncbi:hypothetical protein CJ030_MR1G014077 [Morella rubra]|uniref:Uncharacterized protein n=1 Tax=Morella rubra TaxID=262757 RepID=A0A6A1WME5_9ROSI|nr:hypothetical protein CJ030_MR1G014077 [Morella rubra]